MKAILLALFVALLMVGCGEDTYDTALMTKCEACQEVISKEAEKCPQCGHPTQTSKARLAEEEKARAEEEERLAKIKAEEERKRQEEERRLAAVREAARISIIRERELAEVKAKNARRKLAEEMYMLEDLRRKAKLVAEHLDMDDLKTIMKAMEIPPQFPIPARGPKMPDGYTGWAKGTREGQIEELIQVKDGRADGIGFMFHWSEGRSEEPWIDLKMSFKDGKHDGVWIKYYKDGTEVYRETVKDGKGVD